MLDNLIIPVIVIIVISVVFVKCYCKKNEGFRSTPYHILSHNHKVNQYNTQKSKNVKFDLTPNYKFYDKYECINEDPYIEQTKREKNIESCLKKKSNNYTHSNKQKEGPVEYTNKKTHIGPANDFHQCFIQNANNNDLGWESVAKNMRGFNAKLPSSNQNNPVMDNYMFNLKYQNLENPYF